MELKFNQGCVKTSEIQNSQISGRLIASLLNDQNFGIIA